MIADSWCWLISLTYIAIFGSTNATAQGWPSLGRMDWFRIACLRRPQWIVPWIQYDLVMCMTLAYFGWKYVYEFNGYHMSSSFSVFCRYWWVTWPFGGYIYIYHPGRPYSHIFLCKLWVLPVILIYLKNPYDGKICNRVGRAGNFKWQICFELSPGPTPCGKSTSKSNIAKYRRTY